ncbi:MAG: hypothetical protein M3Q93_13220 [Gemmatimonadota bacterium]|nr:hypothetical protein [Gemmatimonadota bacterium]
MRWMHGWMAILMIGGSACGSTPPSVAPVTPAPWLRSDPQRCLIPRDLREGMEDMARRCAETFVRENGYTELAAEDSTRWVRDIEDRGTMWPRVLAFRSGSLDARASTVQCSMRECLVLFRVRRPLLLCAFRALTMSQVFTKIRLAPGGIRDMRCDERQV